MGWQQDDGGQWQGEDEWGEEEAWRKVEYEGEEEWEEVEGKDKVLMHSSEQ